MGTFQCTRVLQTIHREPRSTYIKSLKNAMLELPDPDAYFNDIPAHFGPVLFDVLNAMANKVGDMQYLIGLSMRDGGNLTNVVPSSRWHSGRWTSD